ncbi:hypothetical protein [Faecalimonas sp.]
MLENIWNGKKDKNSDCVRWYLSKKDDEKSYEKQFIEPIEERVGIDKLPAIVLLADEAVYMNHTGIINVEKVVGWMKNIEM